MKALRTQSNRSNRAASPVLDANTPLDTPAIQRLAAAMHTPLTTVGASPPGGSPPSALPPGAAVAAALEVAGREAGEGPAGPGSVEDEEGGAGEDDVEAQHARRVQRAQQALQRFQLAARYGGLVGLLTQL